MPKRIGKKAAGIIRAGIMSRCMPYNEGGNEQDGYWSTLDLALYQKYWHDYLAVSGHRLAEKARDRTKAFTRVHYE